MEDNLIITFDSNPGDVPVLLVSRKIFDNILYITRLEVINEFTGNDAVSFYNLLTKKEENKDER